MHDGILCGMAAFKEHCAVSFWKGSLIVDRKGRSADEAMGQFGRITRIADLPSSAVLKRLRQGSGAAQRRGRQVPGGEAAARQAARGSARGPDGGAAPEPDRAANLRAVPPSHQRDYVEWITEAKREATRATRIRTSVEWLAEGKSRNWKYE